MTGEKKTRLCAGGELEGLRIVSVSLVDHCIYCGSKDLDKPGVHPRTGKACNHPTKLNLVKRSQND